MSSRNKLRIGITAGDPNGIGYEILLRIFSDQRMTELVTPVIYGSRSAFEFYRKSLGGTPLQFFNIDNADRCNQKRVNLIDVGPAGFVPQPGKQMPEAGKVSVDSLLAVAADAARDALDAVVTGPIDKNSTYGESFPFVGHTDFFADRFPSEGGPLMFMVSENVKVGLVTTHTAISDVPSAITQDSVLSHLRLMHRSLVEDFACTNPKIAVLSLNPHSGDGGIMGTEEKDIIVPALQKADCEKLLVGGPFASDGFFGSGAYRKFDAVLAMYHDQGLAPFKSLAQSGGVNFTAGLPIVRTSPAHGVGYDIAGTGTADVSSFREAVFTAVDVVRNRRMHAEITADPLRYVKKRGGDRIQREKNVDEMIPESSEE